MRCCCHSPTQRFLSVLGELEQNQHPGVGLSRYYRVVELAMESNSEDVVETALGQLHKLVGEFLVCFLRCLSL